MVAPLGLSEDSWWGVTAPPSLRSRPMPLNQYCSSRIDPVKTEIDEVGLQALIDGVIEGTGGGWLHHWDCQRIVGGV
jgi:hypothetical protein